MRVAIVGVLIVLAGCVAAPPQDAPPPDESATALPRFDGPLSFEAPVLLHEDQEYPFEEPLAVAAPDGSIYVVAPIHDPVILRSDDDGRTFAPVAADGLRGGDDAALAADGDVLWWFALDIVDRQVVLVVQRSDDRGATFQDVKAWTGELHRPWIGARGDTLVATWVDREGDAPDRAVVAVSHDAGLSWTTPQPISEGYALPGNVVVSRTAGTFFVPFSDRITNGERSNKVAVTHDDGLTWSVHAASKTPGIIPSMAEDADGRLYLVWDVNDPSTDPLGLQSRLAGFYVQPVMGTHMTTSADRGLTWSEPTRLSRPDAHGILPTVVAGASGRVAVAYYASETSPSRNQPTEWRVVLAASHDGGATFVASPATEAPAHVGVMCNQCGPDAPAADRSRLDHLGLAAGEDGVVVAWVLDADDAAEELANGFVLRRQVDVVASRADVRLG